jgi:rod shape-determining protein MreD
MSLRHQTQLPQMAEMSGTQLWAMRAAFIGLCILVVFVNLLPLSSIPPNWTGPELIIALTFAWALRRPDYVPVLSVAIVMLLTDLLYQRPPGLLALLVVLGTEHLKSRNRGLSEAPFLAEWSAVAAVLIVITLMNRLVLAILAVQQAPLGLSLQQLLMTLLFYPAVVALSQSVMGVRKMGHSEIRMTGRGG